MRCGGVRAKGFSDQVGSKKMPPYEGGGTWKTARTAAIAPCARVSPQLENDVSSGASETRD